MGELDMLIKLLSIASPIVAILALVFTRRDRAGDASGKIQRISDNIDFIKDDVRETKGDVKDLNRMLVDHSERIKLMEERQTSMGERIGRLEQRCDVRSAGGTG